MQPVLTLPTRVELRRPRHDEAMSGRRVWLPDYDSLALLGEAQWSGDFRAVGSAYRAENGDWKVEVCHEVDWHRHQFDGREVPSTPYRLETIRVEGLVL